HYYASLVEKAQIGPRGSAHIIVRIVEHAQERLRFARGGFRLQRSPEHRRPGLDREGEAPRSVLINRGDLRPELLDTGQSKEPHPQEAFVDPVRQGGLGQRPPRSRSDRKRSEERRVGKECRSRW